MKDVKQLAFIDNVQRCLLLSVFSIAANLFLAVPLVGDLDVALGSVFVFIAIFMLPKNLVALVVISHLISKLLVGYSSVFMLIHALEILIIYILVNRHIFMLLASLGFWVCLGMPLLWIAGAYGEVFLQEVSVLIAIKKGLTGVLCASIAVSIVAILPKKYLLDKFNAREHSLSSNIFSICASILVVPLLIVSFIFIAVSSKVNESLLVDKSEASASYVSQFSTSYIDKHVTVIDQAARLLNNQTPVENVHQFMIDSQVSVPSFFYITMTDDLGELLFFAPEKFNDSLATLAPEKSTVIDRGFFQNAVLSDDIIISNAMQSRAMVEAPMVNIASPINDNGTFNGIVYGAINLDAINDFRNKIEGVLDSELVVITDRNNKIVYTSQTLGISPLTEFLARPSYHFIITKLPVLSYQNTHFAYTKKQTSFGWNIYILTKASSFTSNIQTNFVISALSLFIVFIVFLFFAYKLSAQISAPLMALIDPDDKAPDELLGKFAHSKEFSAVANKLKRSQFLMQNFENRLKQQVTEKTEQLEHLNLQLAAQAREDGMTHLLNRSGFDEMAVTAIKTSYRLGQPFSLALLDIDHFKKVNDTHGHPFGDKCLQAFSALLQRNCKRDTDIIGRYGGEEFIIFMSGKDVDAHHKLMERVHEQTRKIKLKPSDSDELVSFSVSIGICSVLGNVNMSLPEIVKLADEEMYKCKRNGRDQISMVKVGFSGDAS